MRIETVVCGSAPTSASGFVARPGVVVTVAHAVADADEVTIIDDHGTWAVAAWSVDAGADVASLHAPDVAAGSPARLAPGQPGPVEVRAAKGSVAARIERTVVLRGADIDGVGDHRRPGLQLTAAIDEGDSGAAVIDEDGHVVGMVVARSRRQRDRAWAVGSDALDDVLVAPVGPMPAGGCPTTRIPDRGT